jgi:hypothetical protein
LEVRQTLQDGQLRWVEQFSCACGHAFEAAGAGLPAKVMREALLKQVGRAEVWLDEVKARPVVSKVLVGLLGLKEPQVVKLLAKLPAVIFEGTHAEGQFIALALERLGVKARLVTHLPKA